MTSFAQKILGLLCMGMLLSVYTPVWAKGPHGKAVRSCPRYSGECPRATGGSMAPKAQFQYQHQNANQEASGQMHQNRYMYKYNQEGAQDEGPKIYRHQWKTQQDSAPTADAEGTN